MQVIRVISNLYMCDTIPLWTMDYNWCKNYMYAGYANMWLQPVMHGHCQYITRWHPTYKIFCSHAVCDCYGLWLHGIASMVILSNLHHHFLVAYHVTGIEILLKVFYFSINPSITLLSWMYSWNIKLSKPTAYFKWELNIKTRILPKRCNVWTDLNVITAE